MLHSIYSVQDEQESPSNFLAQVERVAGSTLFHSSEALPKLLRYLADKSLNSPADHVKEYQIATEVLGRSSTFDPQTDACVRVQVGRLRNKLTEYYDSLGAKDEIVIRLPKGGYSLSFEERVIARPVVQMPAPAVAKPGFSLFLQPRFLILAGIASVFASLLTAIVVIYLLGGRTSVHANARPATASPAMAAFWRPFLHDQAGPYLVYSNAAFVGSPVTGMRYFDPTVDQQSQMSQHYTGIGELMGAVRLGVLFDQFGHTFRLKRGGLFTLDDAVQNDLIFLGSPTENLKLSKVLTTREFALGHLAQDQQHRFGVITLHPHPGEAAGFPSTVNPNGEDYAIIALAPGLDPSHRILLLEGTSTLTTQAAVDFVCEEASVAELMRKLGTIGKGQLPTFEAVIQVKITDDVPIESRLVALKRTSSVP